MRFIVFIGIIFLLTDHSYGQTIEYFDVEWEPCSFEEAIFYREIYYDEEGNPIGKVRDWYISKKIQFEGELISVNPDTLQGLCTWHYESGQKYQEGFFDKGTLISEMRMWSESGKEEGVLDKTGNFFSNAYLSEQIKEILGEEFQPNDTTLAVLIDIGLSVLAQKHFDESLFALQMAHDVSVQISNAEGQAAAYHNIGTVFYEQRKYKEALEWYVNALKISEYLQLPINTAISYSSIGKINESEGSYQEALEWYIKAKDIYEKINPRKELADAYNNIGAAYSSLGYHEDALNYYYRAIEIQERLNLETELPTSYNNIGAAYKTKGLYINALEWYNKAVEILKAKGMKSKLLITYSNIGVVHNALGDPDEALKWYHKTLEIQKEIGQVVELSITYNNIGSAYRAQAKYETALRWYIKAKDIQKDVNWETELSVTLNNIGEVYSGIGNLPEALRWYNEAKDIEERLGLNISLSLSYMNIGLAYSKQGFYEKALMWNQKAQAILENLTLDVYLSSCYENIGSIYHFKQKYKEALIFYNKARNINERLERVANLNGIYNNIGAVYADQYNYEEALVWYHKAKNIQIQLGMKLDFGRSLNNIGAVYNSLGKYGEALKWYQRAKDTLLQFYPGVELACSCNNIGVVYSTLGDYNKAFQWYSKAKEIVDSLGMQFELAYAYGNLASLAFDFGQLDTALHYADKTIGTNEDLRSQSIGSADRYLYVDRSLNTVEVGIESAYQLKKLESAFYFSEKGKARELSDLISDRFIIPTNISESLKNSYNTTRLYLNRINQDLNQYLLPIKRKNLIQQRNNLNQKRKELEDQIRVVARKKTNPTSLETVGKKQIQAILDEKEVYVSFFTGKMNTYAFLITSDTLEMIDLGPSDRIQPLVNAFRDEFLLAQRKSIKNNNKLDSKKLEKQFFKYSHKLYEKLWKPLENKVSLEGRKIILTLDGFLNYLPFELLIKDEKQEKYSKYHYLIRDYEINYYPSGTLFYLERSNKKAINRSWGKSFFGLALSDFENNHCYEDQLTFSKLDFSEAEVMSIANQFPQERVTTLINETATEDSLKNSVLSDYRYVHFSTHGVINSKQADFNRILLGHIKEDGCLNVYEIFEQDWEVDLVTLSACKTGLGELIRGEGMVGFTRALMYAGTPSVVLSLWEVADESTKNLFVDYYTELAKDVTDKYDPLRKTQLKMISSKNYSNPYYWAPFVFIGERYSIH